MPLTVISYLTAALAFLILAILMLILWRDRPGSIWVLGAALASVAWAFFLALVSWLVPDSSVISGSILEVGRNAGWFAVLLSVLAIEGNRGSGNTRALRTWIALTAAFLVAVSIPIALPSWAAEGRWHGLIFLLMAIAGLVLVEQAYRNTPPQRRAGIKLLALGLGAMFAFDLFLFADIALFQAVNSPTLQARGLVNALVVPLIAASVSRRPVHAGVPVVSRKLLFYTASLTGAGVYLLAVGATGYYLRQAGGELGALLQVTLLFGAALVLALVLFSGTFRARLRVYLAKHLFKYRYDYRHEWLRFTATLSHNDPAVPFSERAVQAIGELAESPGGLLWVRQNDGRLALDGALNLESPSHPPMESDAPLVGFLARTGWVVDLEEFRRRPEIYRGLELPAWLLEDARYWAVIPLLGADGLVGFVVLLPPLAPHRIDWEERDLLKTAGRQLAVYVALVHTGEALLEARQFETLHRLSAFLVHDLKNVSAQLSLICSNAARHRDNPEFVDDALRTIANARDRLERTQAQLRNAQPRQPAPRQIIHLPTLLDEVVAASQPGKPTPRLEIREPADVEGDREGLKNVVLHLVRNAQEATPGSGHIGLALYTEDDRAIIVVEDNGSGIDEEFLHQRLFRPFQTTKGNAGMGIGLYEARTQIAGMGGRIDVESEVGRGTRFTIGLPMHRHGT
ncbi:XrtA/PEP-CTERM system histidine kinase PrsK [Thioalkalivibrio sp.]|uniref:XrtA/PEP-CTERM system histidine kinase PrsK n=1 Tax=Thioalkalivibrio sp. TaxID=2093813 RepID=UPI0035683C69